MQVLDGEPPANTAPILVDTLPGLHFRYSGGGYTILQQIVEDVTGKPFHQVAHERVLEPLDMTHSTYLCPLPKDRAEYAAAGHRADGEPIAGGWHHYPESAAAGLWTTPHDLALLLVELERTLRGTPGKVIPQALLVEMLTPQIRLRRIGLDGWEGLGFFLSGEDDDIYYGHGGSNEGFRCSLIARKGRGQAAVIMTNADSGDELTEAWMNAVALEYGWTGYASRPPQPCTVTQEQVAGYCGHYRAPESIELDIDCNEAGLVMQVKDQPPLAMLPRTPELFYSKQLNITLQFLVEESECRGLVFTQNGEDLRLERVS